MKRRHFSSAVLASVSLVGISPVLARTADSIALKKATPGWQSIEQCQAMVGRRFSASGPGDAMFELTEVVPYSSRSTNQFFVRFRTESMLPEGVYLLRNGRQSQALFVQPVHGQPGVMEAAFSLRAA